MRIFLVIIFLAIFGAGVLWIANHDGQVAIDLASWHIELSLAFSVFLIVAVIFLLAGLVRFVFLLMATPFVLYQRFKSKRVIDEFKSALESWQAFLLKDHKHGMKCAKKAGAQGRDILLLNEFKAAIANNDNYLARKMLNDLSFNSDYKFYTTIETAKLELDSAGAVAASSYAENIDQAAKSSTQKMQASKLFAQIASSYLSLGDIDSAQKFADWGLNVNKHCPYANAMLVMVYYKQKNKEKADNLLSRLNPKDGAFANMVKTIYLASEDPETDMIFGDLVKIFAAL